jgi:unsaturated rhamnogalacturonyl hydrolase
VRLCGRWGTGSLRGRALLRPDWTWRILYSGYMEAAESLGDARYRAAMEAMGKKFDWQLRSHLPDADDQSVGLIWNCICLKKDPAMRAPTQSELDALLAAPHVSRRAGKGISWCGATR